MINPVPSSEVEMLLVNLASIINNFRLYETMDIPVEVVEVLNRNLTGWFIQVNQDENGRITGWIAEPTGGIQ